MLIAGPTASGKSALALGRARELGGVVVNADALQVYAGLRVLTARPTEADLALAPHRLYGGVPPDQRFSTGAWQQAAAAVIAETAARPLIFVGGTGLYFEALLNGFAAVPDVPPEVVASIGAEIAGLDTAGRARLLAARDPEMAARLPVADPQRVTRALAVLAATGRSLATFQGRPQSGMLDGFELEKLVLNPPREVLRRRIASRFDTMLETGAVEEARTLLALGLDPGLPVMKAIGLREIGAWQQGQMSRESAAERAVIATRQFAKRQRTWFRHRMADWRWIEGGEGA